LVTSEFEFNDPRQNSVGQEFLINQSNLGEDMTTQPHQSIVFIDSQVADYQTLINELPAGIEVHILDSASDGLMQIAAHLQQRSGLNSLHLISHGEPGAI